ncbi:MAG: nucleotidyltransferase [Caldiserica bacterium]|nr:nucleotidyltransferase [Caldisericota bacterium]
MEIKKKIEEVFSRNEGIPLYYIESGSRLWVMESPDSDYDVRGFHLQSKREYLDFLPHPEIIEILSPPFDFVSYSIDKMFSLLARSNPTVLEWIRAHIIYYNRLPGWEGVKEKVIGNFDAKALFHHYLSLARNQLRMLENNQKFTYKTILYSIRGLLSAEVASRGYLPPLRFGHLLSQVEGYKQLVRIGKICQERKLNTKENEALPEEEKVSVLSLLREGFASISERRVEHTGNQRLLREVLSEYAVFIKERFYNFA